MAGGVLVGYCHGAQVDGWFHDSLVRLLWRERARVVEVASVVSGPLVAAARNTIVRRVLESPAEWLLMLDADMAFGSDLLERLLAVAHHRRRPIVGGLCFSVTRTGVALPVLYRLAQEPTRLERVDEFESEMSPLEVDATGAACLLVHRSVLEALADGSHSPWFDEGELAGERIGEDIVFCLRARQAGFPVHVATSVEVGHVKPHAFGASEWRAQRAG